MAKRNSNVVCNQCGASMHPTKKNEHNLALQLLGVVLFLASLWLLFIPPFGTVIGLLLMVVAGRMGFKRRRVWLCSSCGYFFEYTPVPHQIAAKNPDQPTAAGVGALPIMTALVIIAALIVLAFYFGGAA